MVPGLRPSTMVHGACGAGPAALHHTWCMVRTSTMCDPERCPFPGISVGFPTFRLFWKVGWDAKSGKFQFWGGYLGEGGLGLLRGELGLLRDLGPGSKRQSGHCQPRSGLLGPQKTANNLWASHPNHDPAKVRFESPFRTLKKTADCTHRGLILNLS